MSCREDPARVVRGLSLSTGSQQQWSSADPEVHTLPGRTRLADDGADTAAARIRGDGRRSRGSDSPGGARGANAVPGREAPLGHPGRLPRQPGGPDRCRLWPCAVREAADSGRPVDVSFTSPHATAHVVALSLGRLARSPWVADFRDPWYEEPPEAGTPRVVHWAARHLERRVVHRAAAVVASTERLRDALAARYAGEPREKFWAIPNGYDDEDFAPRPMLDGSPGSELLILHAGGINPTFRDPRPLFAAVREAGDRGALDMPKVRFRFLGGGPFGDSPQMKQAVEAAGLAGRVEFCPGRLRTLLAEGEADCCCCCRRQRTPSILCRPSCSSTCGPGGRCSPSSSLERPPSFFERPGEDGSLILGLRRRFRRP